MATLSQMKSRRMYSWWWDSHMSPKNSKWLQDNLTDMDSKVKSMIKLIEEDADSFARRAEMYYKKRPELMKLVEEFYRAYRALAERYDHATVVIRQAHRTMSEAFPNQDPSSHFDDSTANFGSGDDPRTPDTLTPQRALFHADDQQKNGSELSSANLHDAKRNGEYTEDSDLSARTNELKQRNNHSGTGDNPKFADSKVRKGLNFHDMDDKEQGARGDGERSLHVQALAGANQGDEPEEILILKKALAEKEAEKEAGLAQYQQSLLKISQLESEISRAQEDSQELGARASIAEAEVQKLNKALAEVQAEKDANLRQYHQCLDKVIILEQNISQAEADAGALSERATKAENEAQFLRDELEKVTSEKNAALDQYVLALEKVSNLENRLEFAEEDCKRLCEHSKKAEGKIETLKQEISKLSEEKERLVVQHQQCQETISVLEIKLSSAQEEIEQLRSEIVDGVSKLKSAEEKVTVLETSNQTLKAGLETLTVKVDAQGQELTEKQKEFGRLWSSLQEERLRFVEAETAFQTLQHLHAQTQEELRSLSLELQSRVNTLKDIEVRNQNLQDEVFKFKEENMSLEELNASSAMSMKNMQEDISILTETKGKLEQEVELRVDQRNALQQEIYCLKEELNDLNTKHVSILEQVHAVGLSAESLQPSVKKLQDENSHLKETCKRAISEKEALLVKLEILGQLLDKNSILENSLSDLSAELEAARGKIKALEESCQSLGEEKSQLFSEKASLDTQLQVAIENLDKLTERNNFLENSLSDAHDELQTLKEKLESMENSCQLLANQKSNLASEKDNVSGQLETTRVMLEELQKRFAELEARYLILEEEKTSAHIRIEELQISLDEEKQEHANVVQMNESQVTDLQCKIHLLQDECQERKREFDAELDRALHSEIEIFILKRCAQDLEDANISLLAEYDKVLEASSVSETLISQFRKESSKQQNEVKSLSYQASNLRTGMFQLLKALDLVAGDTGQNSTDQDLFYIACILQKIENAKRSYRETEEEIQIIALEKTVLLTLLQQLIFESKNLEAEKMSIEQELKIRTEHSLMMHSEALRLYELSDKLKLQLSEGNQRKEALIIQVENLEKNLLEAEGTLQDLKAENLNILEEKQYLTVQSALLKDNNDALEEENFNIFLEMLSMSYLSLILKNSVHDRSLELKELNQLLTKLKVENDATREKLNSTEKKLGEVQMDNMSLQVMLQKSEDDLKIVAEIKEKLSHETELAKNELHEELGKAGIQELVLQSEIEKLKNDIEIWETQASLIFGQLQTSTVFQVLYEQKVHELSEACNSLEHAKIAKDTDNKLLNERVSTLASENEVLGAKLTAYGPALTSLKECIYSLEKRTLHTKLQSLSSEESQGMLVSDEQHKDKDDNVIVEDALLDLQDMQKRVQTIENSVVEMEQLVMQEDFNVHSQLEAALRRIDELKSENRLHRPLLKPKSEISEADNLLLTKDIMLDQISECSSYGISKRELVKVDNQVPELWETVDQDDSIGLSANKVKKIIAPTPEEKADFRRVRSLKKKKGGFPSSDGLVEKELGVDKLEISRKSSAVLEGNSGKILQRLNSDVQKLANLHITVQDLKKKLDITEKGRKGKPIDESDTLKGQLEEAEATILKLFDLNGKLMKSVDDSSLSSDRKYKMEVEDSESVRRKRISDQARKISEKIGRLQLEVQKIQFELLRLNAEKESKGRPHISESKRRVLLRDYLYGVPRTSQSRRKKATFCACVQPPTRD